MGVQSRFRESYAQTDPFTPQFTTYEGENPEVLDLVHMKYGSGLPATMEEMEYIDFKR